MTDVLHLAGRPDLQSRDAIGLGHENGFQRLVRRRCRHDRQADKNRQQQARQFANPRAH